MFSSFFDERARAIQNLHPELFESVEDSDRFFTNLAQDPEFVRFVKHIFRWHPRPDTEKYNLFPLINAARKDGSGYLRFGSSFLRADDYCANPWIRLLARNNEDALASMLMSFIAKIVGLARPGREIVDGEWADKILHRGKFRGHLVLLRETRLHVSPHEILVYVQMRISPSQEDVPLLRRYVDLAVEFETHTDLRPVSGGESKFHEGMLDWIRPGTTSATVTEQFVTSATPLVRLNAVSSDHHLTGNAPSSLGQETTTGTGHKQELKRKV